MKRVHIFILLLFAIQNIQSQEVRVEARLDSSKILIGDQINYKLIVTHPAGMDILYPYKSDTLVPGIEILRAQGPDTISINSEEVEVQLSFLITSFDTGFYEIPPQFAQSGTESGVKRYYSDYKGLEVVRTEIAPADSTSVIFDIVGPRKARITFMELLPWGILLSALVLAAIFIFRYFVRRTKPEPDETAHLPSEPIHIIALRELDKLEKKELWQKSQHKIYYSILTEILRTYLDHRYGISSLEMTSGETLESLLEAGFEKGELYTLLEDIFWTADLSKFAKYKPVDTSNIKALEDTRHFIKNTCRSEINAGSDLDNNGKEESDE